MSVEAAHFALVLAFALALAQSVLPMVGARANDRRLMEAAAPVAVGQFAFVLFAFAGLVAAYVTSDFSVRNVWANSHTEQPLIYRVTSTWGNHEGSMLLWCLILALFGASVALFGAHLPVRLKALTLGVQGWIATAFLAFVLFTSNPFERLSPVPGEGQDLNPILQDLGLAIHPPLLYVGYVGFSITFAFAVAALIDGRLDAAWARWVRPWALGAWAFLTLGIAMGSYWAYYELGWGGWWFWDPVENASLMPWLLGTALLHSAIVVEKRNALRIWTVLLALLTFALSLLGTFLVRSGVLTSVHSFASDPTRGIAILAILLVFVAGSLTLFAWRAPALRTGGLFAPVSRESALVLNNLFLSVATATVLVGTLYPLAHEALSSGKISVGPPYFNLAVTPIFAALAVVVPFGPFLPWKRGDLKGTLQRLGALAVLVLAMALAVHLLANEGATLAPLGIAIGLFCILGTAVELLWRARLGKAPFAEVARRLTNLSRSAWGRGARPCGRRRRGARRRGVGRLVHGGDRTARAWRDDRGRGTDAAAGANRAGARAKLGRAARHPARRRGRYGLCAIEARLHRTRGAHDRGGDPHGGFEPNLSLVGGRRRRGDRRARLPQAVDNIDLGRGASHGLRRVPVASRPSAAHRRGEPAGAGGRMRWFAVVLLLLAAPAFALDPEERLTDPALEARARALSAELRCVVCQNESIDASEATIARDLRTVVRERLVAGDSDEAIRTRLVERYGEFVLFRPRWTAAAILLWLTPLVLLVGAVAWLAVRRRGPTADAPLSDAEEARLRGLL